MDVNPLNETIETVQVPFKRDNGWFIATIEGVTIGPFKTEADAQLYMKDAPTAEETVVNGD